MIGNVFFIQIIWSYTGTIRLFKHHICFGMNWTDHNKSRICTYLLTEVLCLQANLLSLCYMHWPIFVHFMWCFYSKHNGNYLWGTVTYGTIKNKYFYKRVWFVHLGGRLPPVQAVRLLISPLTSNRLWFYKKIQGVPLQICSVDRLKSDKAQCYMLI